MKPLRTRFAKDIVAEFLPPKKKSQKVIIFLSGAPSVPRLSDTLNFYSQKGFWVFHPRYRGSWESEGSFLEKSPEQDVIDIINQLPKGFVELETGKNHKVHPIYLYLFGCSFGGPAALLVSRDKRVSKTVVLSPVIDWQSETKAEPLSLVLAYTQKAYGNGYRVVRKNWQKLTSGKFYNPINHLKEIDGRKILVFHAKDDNSVNVKPTMHFCKETKASLVLMKKGGHFSSAFFSKQYFYKKIKSFL
jgi:dipeptidyl aminopeptidase/acylaminoacyl peptidase